MRYALALFLLAALPLSLARSADLTFLEQVVGNPDEALPLVIAIHGLGDSPERFAPLFAGLDVPHRLIVPRAPDPWGEGTSWFPMDDAQRMAVMLRERSKLLSEFAARITKTRKVRGLPIVTGFSQGGCLSFALAAYHSERFSAALPIAGMLPSPMPPYRKARADFRVVAFHGADDARIVLRDAERTTAQLKKVGTRATLAVYPGVGHGLSAREERDYLAALREELAR